MAFIRNGADIECGTVTSGNNVTITHASATLVDGSRSALVVWTGALNAQRTLVGDDPITIPAGDLVFQFPAGSQGITNTAVDQALDDLVANYDTNWTIRLGTGVMGAAGTTNEVTTSGYTAATNQTLTVSPS